MLDCVICQESVPAIAGPLCLQHQAEFGLAAARFVPDSQGGSWIIPGRHAQSVDATLPPMKDRLIARSPKRRKRAQDAPGSQIEVSLE
jgi:hypothetical protein